MNLEFLLKLHYQSYIICLKASFSLNNFKFYFLPFFQCLKTVSHYTGKMHKYIFPAFWFNKTKTLFRVEPFYSSFYFIFQLSLIHISEPTRLGMISYAV